MIKKIDLLFVIIFITIFSIFILTNNSITISNDSINYIENILLINNFFYNLNLQLENIVYYPILYSLILSFFISKNDTIELFNCLDSIQNCTLYFGNIVYLHLLFFLISAIIVFLIAQKLLRNKILSYISSTLFLLNSYYLSRIFFIGPEIIAISLFLISFYLIINYLEIKNTKYYYLFIFFSSILILVKPIFLIINFIFFCYLYSLQKIKFKKLIISIIILLSFFQTSNYLKDKLINDNIHDYEFTVIEQRTAYAQINYDELIPLLISFVPKVGSIILESTFENKKIKRVKIMDNQRNFFYNNRDKLNQKASSNSFKKKILIKNLKNIDKQILLTPIFLFRGIFMQGGYSDFYSHKFDSSFMKVYIYLNYIFFTLSKIYLFYISAKLVIRNKKNNLQIVLFYPLLIFIVHAILTHNLPRYTSILFAIGAVFMVQKIYKFIINFYKQINV